MNDNGILETIRQHYNGIDINRLLQRFDVAKQKAAKDEGVNLWFGLVRADPEQTQKGITPNTLLNRLKYNDTVLQATAIIYDAVGGKEMQIAADLETIGKCTDKSTDLERLETALKRLKNICNLYHNTAELMPKYEVKRQPMQAATNAAETPTPKILTNPEIANLFERFTTARYCSKDGVLYQWNKPKALFAYMVDEVSDAKKLRPSNDKIPWDLFLPAFTNITVKDKSYLKTIVSKYTETEKKMSYNDKPEGWQELQEIIYQ